MSKKLQKRIKLKEIKKLLLKKRMKKINKRMKKINKRMKKIKIIIMIKYQ